MQSHALMVFEHEAAQTPHCAPSRRAPPQIGSRVQFAKVDESAPLPNDKTTFMQKVMGKIVLPCKSSRSCNVE